MGKMKELGMEAQQAAEPNVLERLRAEQGHTEDRGIKYRNTDQLEVLLADAIAEIERLREESDLRLTSLFKMSTKLQQYTEAEPVRWEKRRLVHSDLAYAWVDAGKGEVEASLGRYEFRALIVAPEAKE